MCLYAILPLVLALQIVRRRIGEVSEWSKVLDSKSSVRQRTVGSNPTLSAMENQGFRAFCPEAFFVVFYCDSLFDSMEFYGTFRENACVVR